jgi:hypothetical protein
MLTRWFDADWFRYLFDPYEGRHYKGWLGILWCRLKGHPNGTVYYNPNGFEPDNHCKDCGEDLG